MQFFSPHYVRLSESSGAKDGRARAPAASLCSRSSREIERGQDVGLFYPETVNCLYEVNEAIYESYYNMKRLLISLFHCYKLVGKNLQLIVRIL